MWYLNIKNFKVSRNASESGVRSCDLGNNEVVPCGEWGCECWISELFCARASPVFWFVVGYFWWKSFLVDFYRHLEIAVPYHSGYTHTLALEMHGCGEVMAPALDWNSNSVDVSCQHLAEAICCSLPAQERIECFAAVQPQPKTTTGCRDGTRRIFKCLNHNPKI